MRTDGRAGGQTDRQTHMTKLIFAFRNFANAPKNGHNWNRTDVLSRKFLIYNAAIVLAFTSSSLTTRTVNITLFFQTVVVTPSTLLRCYTFLKTVLHAGSSRPPISRIQVPPSRWWPSTRLHGVITRNTTTLILTAIEILQWLPTRPHKTATTESGKWNTISHTIAILFWKGFWSPEARRCNRE
jgi:hypothetical protein